jgi:hypothetical protein
MLIPCVVCIPAIRYPPVSLHRFGAPSPTRSTVLPAWFTAVSRRGGLLARYGLDTRFKPPQHWPAGQRSVANQQVTRLEAPHPLWFWSWDVSEDIALEILQRASAGDQCDLEITAEGREVPADT